MGTTSTNLNQKHSLPLGSTKDAHERRASLRSVTPLSDSKGTAVHEAPGTIPSGKKRRATVEFTFLGNSLGPRSATAARRSGTPRLFPFRIATDNQKRRTVTGTRSSGNWLNGKAIAVCQGTAGASTWQIDPTLAA